MPFIRYSTKRAARRAQRTWLLGVAKFEILARILELVPGTAFGSAASHVIAIAMGYLAVEAGSAAEDPPRPDYATSTRAKRRKLPMGMLGDSDLERQSARFADASAHGAAYLAAFVRAVERSQMAEEIGDPEALRSRLSEAETYALRARPSIWKASEEGHGLSQTLEADERLREAAQDAFRGAEGERLLGTPYWEKLDRKTLDLFRKARVDPRELANYWDQTWPEDPVRSCVATLREALESATVFADSLRDWGPERERPPAPSLWDA